MKILIAAIGSMGDVNPFVKIGTALRQRGHDITFLSNRYFSELVKNAGLDFISVGSVQDYNKMVEEVDLNNPSKIMIPILNRLYFPSMQKVYDAIKEKYAPGETIVIGITMAFGARIAQEKLGIPLITCHLSPVSFRSSIRPARHYGLWMPDWMPKFYKDGVWKIVDIVADKIMAPPINEMRDKLGLPPVKGIMKDWIHSPEKVIGLFPDWFAKPQADWPNNAELTNFVLFDDAANKPLQPELKEFIDIGNPPIIFTAGSAVKDATAFFKESAKACETLDKRAVFISGFKDHIPKNLPKSILFSEYAPFSKLLPKASLLVHHAGIGTCAQALKAGIPQLLTPFGIDHHENSSRIVELGVGAEVCTKKYKGSIVAEKIEKLLGDNDMHTCCKNIADKIKNIDSLTDLCRIIEDQIIN
jgi:rhamnosyltransferase subunit B